MRDQVFLFSKNITTDRSFKKLKDKMLDPFPIVKKVETSYELQLPQIMKVHNVFHLNLLHKDSGNPLSSQVQELSESIVTADNEAREGGREGDYGRRPAGGHGMKNPIEKMNAASILGGTAPTRPGALTRCCQQRYPSSR